jgi:hypothetical protein
VSCARESLPDIMVRRPIGLSLLLLVAEASCSLALSTFSLSFCLSMEKSLGCLSIENLKLSIRDFHPSVL